LIAGLIDRSSGCTVSDAIGAEPHSQENGNVLGTPVWAREGRQLRLTQAGQYLLGLANRLLPQFEYAEEVMRQYAEGGRGTLRIGMECHPCYQWLLKVVAPYLSRWQDVDVDVKQKFQFGGIGALLNDEIDLLVTPDPLYKTGLLFTPVLIMNKCWWWGATQTGRENIFPPTSYWKKR
jgi:DNA-binding transcriptional LysR family regulator